MDTSQFATGMLPVLYEDDQLIAVEKPAGLLSQPSADEEDSVLTRVSSYLGRRAGLVQRLDRPVSGMLVLAKNAKTTRWLNKCIARGKTKKYYVALVRTVTAPVSCEIREPIAKVSPGKVVTHARGKPARTLIKPLHYDAGQQIALVAVQLCTGRMHQARVHLAAEVGAIVGDAKYGDVLAARRIGLHAVALALPASGAIAGRVLSCSPPDEF